MSYFLVDWKKLVAGLYLTGLGMLLVSLPIFNVGMSVSLFWVSGVWLIDFLHDAFVLKNPWIKFRRFAQNKWAIALVSLFLIHVVGLIHTTDFDYAMKDLRVKVPLFILPFVVSGFPLLSEEHFRKLILFFIAAVSFATFTCLMVYWGWVDRPFHDIREITSSYIVRISHIRLGLMAALALTFIGYWIYRERKYIFLIVPAVIMLYFLWVIESMTGIGVLAGAVASYLFYLGIRNRGKMRWLSVIAAVAIIGSVVAIVGYSYKDYHKLSAVYKPENLPTHTSHGEPYDHQVENLQVENGHYVWWFVAWNELQEGWNEKGTIPFDSTDANGEKLYGTIIRYMTSRGLHKDADGVAQLTPEDIARIEAGVCSVTDGQRSGLRARLDKVFLELDIYMNQGDPSGHSLTQRFEFWRAGWHAMKSNWIIGVGTGDVPSAMSKSYEEINSKLDEGVRFRAHNQYLTLTMAFGLVGIIWVLWVLLMPVRLGYLRDYYFFMFYSISLFSWLTEDTLESQAGLCFFVFFISIISVARDPISQDVKAS